MKQFSFIVIGAGDRGLTYTKEMLKMPEKYELVGMADIHPEKRDRYKEDSGLRMSSATAIGVRYLQSRKWRILQ
ncbi:MAG: hypothetical protein IJW21_06150 [Clostridia bacterium]|nr:hypothetical protein [Clostridia bacterium]